MANTLLGKSGKQLVYELLVKKESWFGRERYYNR